MLTLPEADDQDAALRQVLRLYDYPWPLLLGRGLAARSGPGAPLGAAGRPGEAGRWRCSAPPFGAALAAALAVARARRRAGDGAPGRLEPPPGRPQPAAAAPGPARGRPGPGRGRALSRPSSTAAVEAYRAGRSAEAHEGLRRARGARATAGCCRRRRASTARCVWRASGSTREARRILLRTGDSRFEDAIDDTLERVAPASRRARIRIRRARSDRFVFTRGQEVWTWRRRPARSSRRARGRSRSSSCRTRRPATWRTSWSWRARASTTGPPSTASFPAS